MLCFLYCTVDFLNVTTFYFVFLIVKFYFNLIYDPIFQLVSNSCIYQISLLV
jgi:hypothetical protein